VTAPAMTAKVAPTLLQLSPCLMPSKGTGAAPALSSPMRKYLSFLPVVNLIARITTAAIDNATTCYRKCRGMLSERLWPITMVARSRRPVPTDAMIAETSASRSGVLTEIRMCYVPFEVEDPIGRPMVTLTGRGEQMRASGPVEPDVRQPTMRALRHSRASTVLSSKPQPSWLLRISARYQI